VTLAWSDWPNDRNQMDNINAKHLLPIVGLGHVAPEGRSILGRSLLPKIGRASLVSAVAKLPNIPGLKIEGSRVLPPPQAQGRRNPDLYNVMVEIDVSIVGESETYVFNCIRNGQLTLIQPMGRRPGSLAQGLSVEDRACIATVTTAAGLSITRPLIFAQPGTTCQIEFRLIQLIIIRP
jgi:hypothetical protein